LRQRPFSVRQPSPWHFARQGLGCFSFPGMAEPKAIIHEFDTPDLVPPRAEPGPGFDCDVCGEHFEGEPAGSGLFMWTRGEEVRFEEPPLCETCAQSVTLDALTRFEVEEEEEG
jgi:hypothetical protein